LAWLALLGGRSLRQYVSAIATRLLSIPSSSIQIGFEDKVERADSLRES